MNQAKPTYKQQGNVGLFEQLFDKFCKFLEENHLIMKEDVMIDGSFVEAPRQRNTREENKQIKEGWGGLQHPDKPGLQPVPLRTSDTSWNELTN